LDVHFVLDILTLKYLYEEDDLSIIMIIGRKMEHKEEREEF
jgi:hypothetical protein